MSTDPFGGETGGLDSGAPPPADVSSMVSGPAIALIVVAAINILSSLFQMVQNVIAMTGGAAQQIDQEGAEALEELGINPMQLMQGAGAVGIVLNIIALVVAGVIIMGALKMKKTESYGLAMTSSVLAMIPCISPCCILGLPLGIWSLVVLNKPEVKSAFR